MSSEGSAPCSLTQEVNTCVQRRVQEDRRRSWHLHRQPGNNQTPVRHLELVQLQSSKVTLSFPLRNLEGADGTRQKESDTERGE